MLQGISQSSGPAVLLYWLGGSIPAVRFRANIILFFVVLTLITGVTYTFSGLITHAVLSVSLALVAPYGYTGQKLFGVASESTFRRVCYVLIAIAAVIGMPIHL